MASALYGDIKRKGGPCLFIRCCARGRAALWYWPGGRAGQLFRTLGLALPAWNGTTGMFLS